MKKKNKKITIEIGKKNKNMFPKNFTLIYISPQEIQRSLKSKNNLIAK